ncbi:MAG: hypothetical protein AAGM22_13870 [Acidobacteriota bacterium]
MLRLIAPLVTVPLLAVALSCVQPHTAHAQAPAADNQAESATAKAWWNQTRFIDRLALTAEARQKMDALLTSHLASADAKARVESQEKLNAALLAGDWDAARTALGAVNDARTEGFTAQTELKIEVLQLLAPNQRKVIADDFPRLMSRPWVRPQREGAKAGGRRTARGR